MVLLRSRSRSAAGPPAPPPTTSAAAAAALRACRLLALCCSKLALPQHTQPQICAAQPAHQQADEGIEGY